MDKKKADIVIGKDKDKDFEYADVAIHCSQCNKIMRLDDPSFKKLQTGMLLFANSDSRLSLACENCGCMLSLIFIESPKEETGVNIRKIEHVISKEDVELNPDEDLKEGEEIEIPIEDEVDDKE